MTLAGAVLIVQHGVDPGEQPCYLRRDLQLLAKANANIGDSPTKEDVLDGLYTVKDETLDGLIAPITFTKGELASHRPCFWPYIFKDGEFTNPLGGITFQCYPPAS